MKTSTETDKIFEALMTARKNVGTITKDAKNPFYKSNYADLNSVLDAVTEPLLEQGILILQPTETGGEKGELNLVTTRLQHVKSGQWIESSLKLEMSKPGMQDLGAGISYARRYELLSLLTLKTVDDDAESTMDRKPKDKTVSFRKASNGAKHLETISGPAEKTMPETDRWE